MRKASGAARRGLTEYGAKRNFRVTPEPAAGGRGQPASAKPRFVVHKHDATRLDYDVRLEIDGALASWAVPKGPSFDPSVRRLAVETEDHPLEYGEFEGRIPDGEYGAGDSLLWDQGTFETVPPGQAERQRAKGHLHVELTGEKLRGRWHLIRTRSDSRQATRPQWLMFKAKDDHADPDYDVLAERPESVVSGKTMTRGPERKATLRAVRPPPERLLQRVFPPMLATLVAAPPASEDDGYLYELKYDGYRALSAISQGRVAMCTRNALDLTGRFPTLAADLAKIVVGDAVVDGEIVALDARGAPRFELLQQREKDSRLIAFDLLWLDGEDLRPLKLEQRRELLESLLAHAPDTIRLAARVGGRPEEALREAGAQGYEGLIAKKRGAAYEPGRTRAWLKLKVHATQELAVVGFTPSKATAGDLGALLLGVASGGVLHFAGKVGTGFSSKLRRELARELSQDQVDAPMVEGAPRLRAARWVKPRLVAQVRFTEWTADGKLRHPAFQGLRPDKTPMECVRERPTAPPTPRSRRASAVHVVETAKAASRARQAAPSKRKASKARREPSGGAGAPSPSGPVPPITLTSPDRVVYPRDGITKLDVSRYYDAVSAPLLAALAGRPLSLEHWSRGIDGPTWYHQNVGRGAPAWATVVETPARTKAGTVAHVVADRPETLAWLAQRSALTLHMWGSRAGSLESPDWVVFDLDPAEGRSVEQAIPVALALREALERCGLPSVPKTSGKRGLHLFIPLAPGHDHDEVLAFALGVGRAVAKAMPGEVTLERSKAKRDGRLYLDCMQNAYAKTVVAPYSLRAIDGAPVSAPLTWKEVTPRLDPAKYNLRTMPARLAKLGDLFAPALTGGVRLPRLA